MAGADGFTWALRPMLLLSAALGFVPFRLRPNGLALAHVPFAYTLALAVVYAACIATELMEELDSEHVHLEDAVELFVVVSSFVAQILTLLLFASLKLPAWGALLSLLRRADALAAAATGDSLGAANARRRRWTTCMTLGALALCGVELAVIVRAYGLTWTKAAKELLHHVSNLVLIMQYFCIALLLTDRFQLINAHLRRCAREDAAQNTFVLKRHLTSLHGPRTPLHGLSDPQVCARGGQLRRLQFVHLTLCEAADTVSNIYGLPMLFEMGYLWTEAMILAFYVLLPSSRYGGESPLVKTALALGGVRSALASLGVCWGCDVAQREARRTAKVLAKLLVEETMRSRSQQLQLFAHQLVATDVDFNCCGFFSINLKLLFGFFGTIFGYLVILMQIDAS